jgi:diguanylate cyclase (GGDEF)-like protein
VTSRRRDEKRWSDHSALVAASVALLVSLAAVIAILVNGAIDTQAEVISIVAPGVAAAVATAIAVHFLVVRRHRIRERASRRRLAAAERELDDGKRERTGLRELDAAIDLAATEHDAIEALRGWFVRYLPAETVELHLIDRMDPIMELALATGDRPAKQSRRSSPWESLATRTNITLVYETTDRLDVCAHLKARLDVPMSAVAVPVNAMGRLLGVLYSLGPEGREPLTGEVRFLEDLGRLIGARLAILRASTDSPNTADDVDRLTGLPNRAAMQERVLRMLRDRQPFTVAIADIDNFGDLNETQGRAAGDRALQLLGRVTRRALRPGDVIGRIGGDEFLFVLPKTAPDDATRAFERLREELVLAQSTISDPSFTLSIGLIGSTSGGTIEEILHRAAGALDHARSQGGNRVVVAHTTRDAPPAS